MACTIYTIVLKLGMSFVLRHRVVVLSKTSPKFNVSHCILFVASSRRRLTRPRFCMQLALSSDNYLGTVERHLIRTLVILQMF